MNIEEAKQELIHTIQAYTARDPHGNYKIPMLRQRPVLLIGPPGIGKTAIVSQAAESCGVGFISYTMTHHTRQSAVGLPVVKEKEYQGITHMVTEYTMSEILASVYEYMEKTGKKEGILFLDEINCVSETLVPTMLQFLQSKTFGNHKVPQGWILMAAGNPQEYNKSARSFDIVTLDRVRCISVDVDCDTWFSYAAVVGIHGAILSYLRAKPENFYYIEQNAVEKDFVTARGWEDLSVLICGYEALDIPVDEQVTGQYLQCEEIARDFARYYGLYRRYQKGYDIPGILDGRTGGDDLEAQREHMEGAGMDERFAVVQMFCGMVAAMLGDYQEQYSYVHRLKEVARQLIDYREQHRLEEPVVTIENFTERFRRSLEIKDENHILTEAEGKLDGRIYQTYGDYCYQIRGKRFPVWEDCLGELENLEKNSEQELEKMSDCLDQSISSASKFIEESCGEGMELSTFIEQICMNPAGAEYLSNHPQKDIVDKLSLIRLTEQEAKLQEEIRNLNLECFEKLQI